ncbi:MAG: hypothetical protein ABI035_06480 [Gemmatimonadaceae bacterium]
MRIQQNSCRVVSRAGLACLLVAGIVQSLGAQVAYDAPDARVEVLGLRHWTLKALQDSIQHRVPGQTLADAACMVTLRDSLHFADALVMFMTYPAKPGVAARHYEIIKVIEPQDSSRVRWTPSPRDTFKVLRPGYATVILPVTDSLGRLLIGRLFGPLQLYNLDPAARATFMRGRPHAIVEDADRLWNFLNAHRTEADRRTAVGALHKDGPYANRMVAAALLANFADQDSTWWALTDALRDGNEGVRSTALIVLDGLPARRVDWTPAVPALRALLGGTNVSATQDVLELLNRTQVSAALARPLLHGNGSWVLTHLRAEYPGAHDAAHALLVRLNNGRDLGPSDSAWAHWLAAL